MANETTDNSRFPDGFRILHGKQEYITYREHSSVRIWASDVAGHYDNHVHSAIEVILLQRGTAIYQLPDQTYRVQPGQILFIPSGCPHALTETDDTLRYLLLFEPSPLYTLQDMPQVSFMTRHPIYLQDKTDLREQVCHQLMEAIDCYFQKKSMWNTQCYAYLMQVYALLGRQYLDTAAPHTPAARKRIDPEIMNSVMTYISEHYMDDICLSDAAAFAGFSKYYFSRVFKEFAGVSFSEYLLVKRLNAASNLLIRTIQPIHEIAQSSGFGSVATFNRVFREQKKCTPTQFRAIYGTMVNADINMPIFHAKEAEN